MTEPQCALHSAQCSCSRSALRGEVNRLRAEVVSAEEVTASWGNRALEMEDVIRMVLKDASVSASSRDLLASIIDPERRPRAFPSGVWQPPLWPYRWHPGPPRTDREADRAAMDGGGAP